MMDKNIITQLEKITGKEGVLVSPEDLAVYSYDGAFDKGCPEVVVLPHTTEQVSEIIQLAAAEGIPVVTTRHGIWTYSRFRPFPGRDSVGNDTDEPYPGN